MLSKQKVITVWTLRRISDAIHFLEDRAHAHPTPEATVVQDQEVSPSTPEASRTLTFAELQSLIEQGKMDEIPNNKHIPDTINVVLVSHSILSCLAHMFATGGRTQPVERPPTQKALGGPIVVEMTSEARVVLKGNALAPLNPSKSYMINLTCVTV